MKNLLFYKNTKSDFVIVRPSNPTESETCAINNLNQSINDVCGIQLRVIDDNEPTNSPEIIIGNCVQRKSLFFSLAISLEKDAFYLFNIGNKIFINGDGRGIIFGVNYFLENYLRIKKLYVTGRNGQCPKEKFKINTLEKIYISSFNFNLQTPAFSYRWIECQESYSRKYSDFNKLSFWKIINPDPANLEDTGESVHNLTKLFGYDTRFINNPNYYPYINGARTSEYMAEGDCRRAPCLSQEGVFDIVKTALITKINSHPELQIWNLSQPDGMIDYCNCTDCKPKHDQTGGFSNTFFPFINRMAKSIKEYFQPHNRKITIKTLAYNVSLLRHTVETNYGNSNVLPAGKLENNVMLMFCPTENNKIKAIATSTDSKACKYRSLLSQWSQSGASLYIWEYIVNFAYYLFPFPTLHVLQDNLKYYKSLGVKSFFANYSSTEDSSLRGFNAYAYSRLLWNPEENLEGIINDFCKNYYGVAHKEMRKYIKLLLQYAKNDNSGNWIAMAITSEMIKHANPKLNEDQVLFSIKHLQEFYILINMALSKLEVGSDEWKAVKREQICLKQVEIEASCEYANPKPRLNSMFDPDFQDFFFRNNTGSLEDKIRQRCDDFKTDCKNIRPCIDNMNEYGRKISNYIIDVINDYE